jgi:hypothetical protein
MSAEYSDLETVSGMLSFFGVGLASGFIVDAAAPTPSDSDSVAQLVLQSAVQSGASLMVLTQLMRMILPKRESWLPPCTDASALVGLFMAQPRLRAAIELSLAKLDVVARQQLGVISQPKQEQSSVVQPTAPQDEAQQ